MNDQARRDEQVLDLSSLQRLTAAIGLDIGRRVPIPALAHWAWFPDLVASDRIGVDGHPRPGTLLPDTGKPRRMFASAAIEFRAPLAMNARATFEERITDQRTRNGRTGDLVLMDVERTISQRGSICVLERRTLVYRDADSVTAPVEPAREFAGEWLPNEIDLFRFSAATFNSHRIHYDRRYAMSEGYPDLVVHGPLTACKLAQLAAEDGELASFWFRAEAPLFVNQPIRLERRGDDGFVAMRCDGATAMSATVRWR